MAIAIGCDAHALAVGDVQALRRERRPQNRRPAAGDVPASVLELILLDLGDALLQAAAHARVRLRVAHVAVEFRQQLGGQERVDVGSELALDLRALLIGDGEAFGRTLLHVPQNEFHRARQRLAIGAAGRSSAGVQQRLGRHGGVGDVVALRFQALALAHVGGFAAILSPAAVVALHGDQPLDALVHRDRDRIVARSVPSLWKK